MAVAEAGQVVAAAMRTGAGRNLHIRIPEFDPFRPVQIAIPSGEQYLPEVRQLIERLSIPTWLTRDDVSELKLAATEACLNAIHHGSPLGPAGLVGITVKPTLDRVIVEVCDGGPGFNVENMRLRPIPQGESGRGIRLIDHLVDQADYCRNGRGHLVRLVKKARWPASRAGHRDPFH